MIPCGEPLYKIMLTFLQFKRLCKQYNLIPLSTTLPADLDTPVSVFLKIRENRYDFLFESVVGGEKWARFSFLGTGAQRVFNQKNGLKSFLQLKNFLKGLKVYQADLPRFFGGAVGTIGYDMVAHFDNIKLKGCGKGHVPEFFMFIPKVVVIFDNLSQVMRVLSCVFVPQGSKAKGLKKLYEQGCYDIQGVVKKIKAVGKLVPPAKLTRGTKKLSHTRKNFCRLVEKAKDYILAGDIFQVVLSLKYEFKAKGLKAFDVYRSLRRINPSPYMFFLQLGNVAIAGASPEVLLRVEGKKIEVRPIAGTRGRGDTTARDNEIERELRADPKERAEHIMLLDLGRNDIGRVAQVSSVCVDEREVIERYSHVMHLVSHVSGELASGKDVFDAIRATFPAGTLSGAPKIRAMQIIAELEKEARGIYGGAVGYISFSGNADLAIAIRTAIILVDRVVVQAGAGIVHDSVATREYDECCRKAKAVVEAIEESVT